MDPISFQFNWPICAVDIVLIKDIKFAYLLSRRALGCLRCFDPDAKPIEHGQPHSSFIVLQKTETLYLFLAAASSYKFRSTTHPWAGY